MLSFVFRVIPALFRSALPVVLRLVVLLACFHALRFLLREWKGLKRR